MIHRNLRTHIFADGQNIWQTAKKEFPINITRLKYFISESYPEVEKFLWYDLKPEIAWDGNLPARSYSEWEIARMGRSFEQARSKERFLSYIERHADLVLVDGKEKRMLSNCTSCGNKEVVTKTDASKTDLQLSLELYRNAVENKYDRAVIISGDGDLSIAGKYIKDLKKELIVVSFRQSLSNDLANIADEVVELDSIKSQVELKRKLICN